MATKTAKQTARATPAIRQGIKAEVETVPMPIRFEVDQVRALKIAAALLGTTASAIVRGSVRDWLIEQANGDPAFGAALDSAGVKI
ncbi:hypothetical protein [Caballeronia sp. LZ043]|uniref:hypothetical protein n=1 Tax=Caballeronia sp. LZ043 TaxID=3038569 RepID=UPI00285EABB3|nr:hypothetical protein [Caballeronia sp. LZ043]MDR5819850.1 hypothetical protein [Caballeronia sp. LZ043]